MDDAHKDMLRLLGAITCTCILILLLTGCNFMSGNDNNYNEGDSNKGDGGINKPILVPTPIPTVVPEEAGVSPLLLLVFVGMLLSGCNSTLVLAPNLTLGVNSGSQGSASGVGTDERTGVHMNPKIEREGGATVSASVPSEVLKPDADVPAVEGLE